MSLIIQHILKRKMVSGAIALALIGGGYWGYGKLFPSTVAIRYVTSDVQKGTLIVSVSGSGQISATNQVDLKAKASGDIVYLGIKNGQEVKAGQLLAQVDSRDAQKTVRDAEVSLEQAKVALEKLKGVTTDEGTIRGIKEKAQDDLKKAYDDGFNNVSNAFLDFPDIVTGLYNLLFSATLDRVQWNIDYYTGTAKVYDKDKAQQYRDDVAVKYQEARKEYDKAFADYKNASRYSDSATIENLINETYDAAKALAESTKSAANLIQFYKDTLTARNITPNSFADTHLSALNTYTSKTNSYLLSLLTVKNTILNDKETLANTGFDITDQKIKVTQAENSLLDARQKLADYFIRAPFDGVIAVVNVEKGYSVSASTVVTTIITKQRTAKIAFNEVDVAKVKIGQKVTLTFDAIEGLSISGEVAEIDSIGTVSQGVVNYNVKIVFDTQDDRVKPGMSVSAAVITDVKQDVLLVPNSAVKSDGNGQYVEFLINNAPQSQSVEAGLSNDTMTEIKSGIKEGDKIVIQTITVAIQTQTTQSSTGFRIPGLGGGR
ncbi:MAG: Efflux transporter, RND family, MFP subunit [Candidatus Giovannonibacteria bacterium GW2011_GWB1_45_9b]|uniref:Efflux transporter, RND family, MFP subunit n=1 Tax=Candidatus Giovannonibacteria bacterium GW2011_GWB1_45_9b TaxID=1618653 RepID=A0A0G1N7A2_9BACT|nr:MAG: Efflux transporter, RND family, MFP subunit [Candidatus Giovannonibacteria bacterium GW2011_GWB1_45_9b]